MFKCDNLLIYIRRILQCLAAQENSFTKSFHHNVASADYFSIILVILPKISVDVLKD